MTCSNDNSFGPAVEGCRGDFDFTQKFEKIFFSIIPASIFIAASLSRILFLTQSNRIVTNAILQYAKALFFVAYAAIQLSLLVLVTTDPGETVYGLTISSTALLFVGSLCGIPLSYLEHGRAKRPSSLIGVYMFFTILFDIVQTRTAWMSINDSTEVTTTRLFTSSLALKLFILALEAIPKTRWIRWDAHEHSPEESTNIFSLGVYFWLNKLFLRGYRDVLQIDTLYPLDPAMAAESLVGKLSKRMDSRRYKLEPKLGLLKDMAKTLAGPMLLPVAPRVAMIGFTFCQPLFTNAMLTYLDTPSDERRENIGYGLIGAAALIYTGIAISRAFYEYYNQRFVYMARASLVAAIYRKTTQTKINGADDSAAVTLMSSDVERIVRFAPFVHEIWASVAEIGIGCWLLEEQIGIAFLSPLGVILASAAATVLVVKRMAKVQAVWMKKIQNRVGMTANAISNMKLYKISGITGPVAELIQNLRVDEIKAGNGFRWMQIFAAIMAFIPQTLAPVITFAATTQSLDVTTLYTSLSYILLLTNPLMLLLQIVPGFLAGLVCLQRIQKFLSNDPHEDFREATKGSEKAEDFFNEKDGSLVAHKRDSSGDGSAFVITNGSFGWAPDKMTLKDISTIIPANQLTLVIGPVAAGKSTFCKVLLGEVPYNEGRISTPYSAAQVGYCEQTPFLYNATLRENVIGHAMFNEKRYQEVIDATLLAFDVNLLPDGHDTKIGSNGIMLSGGQKQRVSVARALYSDAEIMIFDDVLSGLDNDTEAELFKRVFGSQGIIRRRGITAIVCTHSVRHLPSADHIIALGPDGTIVEQGHFSALSKNESYVQSLGVRDNLAEDGDEADPAEKTKLALTKVASKAVDAALDDRSRQLGDWEVYRHYFRHISRFSIFSLVVSSIIFGFCNNFANVWMSFWAADSFGHSDAFYLGLYALLKISQLLGLIWCGYATFISMISHSGTSLHKTAIYTVATAPLSFFTKTDSGIVTNLFSQDMTLLDSELPNSLLNVAIDLSEVVAAAFVIASASPYLAIAYPFLIGILYVIQKFYLRTSRQMRLLDLEAKSPLYTHFLDTIKGVATVRAFSWEEADIQRNYKLLDTSQRPAYLLGVIQKWLMTALQLLVAGIAVLLVGLATQLGTSAGLTGASLVTLLSFGEAVAAVVRSYTLLETSIGAVSRLKKFSEVVKPEDQPDEDIEPPESWPSAGRIDMQSVSASYDYDRSHEDAEQDPKSSSKLVLSDLSLTIQPRQKVAICGRTGSGKSSLILLLLRLLDPLPRCETNMEIDGVPFYRIDRTTLRKRIIAIPQEAVFLPDGSTVKSNIDPLGTAQDIECLAVLQAVKLSGFVEDRGGLNAGMSADDLSAGQKQLFSLGRAILRKRVRDRLSNEEKRGGILLLDEVSSSVDKVTDRAMQEIIRDEFENYTIVMVSHRLEMVMDFFDRVVVLDSGVVVETGSPRSLVDTPGTRFGELWAIENHDSI